MIAKRQRTARRGKIWRKAAAVPVGLQLDFGQRNAGLFRFNYADGTTIHVEEVIGKTITRSEKEFANCDPTARLNVDAIPILDQPSGAS